MHAYNYIRMRTHPHPHAPAPNHQYDTNNNTVFGSIYAITRTQMLWILLYCLKVCNNTNTILWTVRLPPSLYWCDCISPLCASHRGHLSLNGAGLVAARTGCLVEGGKLGDVQEVARFQAGAECIHHTDLGRWGETWLRCVHCNIWAPNFF